jgi:hypothetical protein
VHPEKVSHQKRLQVSTGSKEEDKLKLCSLFSVFWHLTFLSAETHSNFAHFFAYSFLLADFSHFSQQLQNQHKIMHCVNTHIKILLY